jgi:hypothetical protein
MALEALDGLWVTEEARGTRSVIGFAALKLVTEVIFNDVRGFVEEVEPLGCMVMLGFSAGGSGAGAGSAAVSNDVAMGGAEGMWRGVDAGGGNGAVKFDSNVNKLVRGDRVGSEGVEDLVLVGKEAA